MNSKRVVLRTCMGCNVSKDKSQLIRIVRSKDGTLSLDLSGKIAGRGAYLCKDAVCLKKVRKSRRIERVLSVSITDELYNAMEEELLKNE